MGMFTEDMEIGAALYEQYLEDCEYALQHRIWESKDGTRKRIEDMSTNHIHNCINYLKNKRATAFLSEEWIQVLTKELDSRQDSK